MNINNNEVKNMVEYQEFLKNNEGEGYLEIRAYGASEALPIQGMNIVVTTLIGNMPFIFFEGETDFSGMIEKIKLPAPKKGEDNLVPPRKTVYNIEAIYEGIKEIFEVNLYDGICVQQIINIVPKTLVRGYCYGC